MQCNDVIDCSSTITLFYKHVVLFHPAVMSDEGRGILHGQTTHTSYGSALRINDGMPDPTASSESEDSLIPPPETTGDSPDDDKWTSTQKWTAVSIALMNISLSVSFSVIAPFFPVEAAKKGATQTEIGLIFGFFELVIFIMSPIYGTFVSISNFCSLRH